MSYKDLLLNLARCPDHTTPAAVDFAIDFAASIKAKLSARFLVPESLIAPAFQCRGQHLITQNASGSTPCTPGQQGLPRPLWS
jgi:hypothetical protein